MSTKDNGPYAAIDESFENATGTDMRLIYGLGVPVVVGVLAIVAFAFVNQVWLAFVLLLAVVVPGAALVMHGIGRMLQDEGGDDETATRRR
jgi:hypothetical protein